MGPTDIPARINASVVRVYWPKDGAGDNRAFRVSGPTFIGMLIGPGGHVVVNDEIIRGRDTAGAIVVVPDVGEFAGRIVGRDPFSNIALLKIDATDFMLPAHGDAAQLKPGETILAISVGRDGQRSISTARVVSSARVRGSRDSSRGPYIEVELAHPAVPFSGPMFNGQGEVVGFVTLETRPPVGKKVLLGMPIDDVKRIADELQISGKIRRGRLGLAVQNAVPSEVAIARGLEEPSGVLVAKVDKGGPADRAGVRPGDIVLRLRDAVIRNTDDFFIAMERIKPGSPVTLHVLRDGGATHDLSAVAGEIVTGPPAAYPKPNQ